jgi:uncharacterized membrane-anchored protein
MKKKGKPIHMLEIIWVIIAVLCLILGIKKAIDNFMNQSLMFFFFTIIALIMFSIRRYLRKNNSAH